MATLRQTLVSKPLLNWYRKILPPMSDTERGALEAGTVWWDAELFSGKPDWNKLLTEPAPQLTAEEQAFLSGPTDELCRMVDDWQINQERDLPLEVWQFIKEQGFLGMIIPKQYGGLGFSALGHSAVITKLSTRSLTTAVTVMVPNSLGPAELLLHYGTEKQKRHYLPRLASGHEIPCFGLTGPHSGSDAASMHDVGTVCYGDYKGERTLGMRVSWHKRYITLGPVATVLGLAFKLSDPDHLLGNEKELGITLALIPTNTPGVNIGRRHYPARQAFQNGPNSGKDVFIPLEWVIGEREGIGRGWHMLMDCLSAGRSISLPSSSTGAVKACARFTGAYARIRKQFKIPIGKFEGVEEPLTRIATSAYVLDAGRQITAAAIDSGAKPSVISAIVKYHFTERMRQAVNDAMDIHGGKLICDGPKNYLLNAYFGLPVPITVEGANILTRSMIIFGQGAIRCHPYLFAEMKAAQLVDDKRAVAEFDAALFGHVKFLFKNLGRSLWHNLTGGRFANTPDDDIGVVKTYYQQLSRASASFALVADITLLILGGELKRREKLSARFGDILSEMYLMSCVLKRFQDDGRPEQDLPLVRWNCIQSLHVIEDRFADILTNFPSKPVAWLLRRIVFPWGRRWQQPSDRLAQRCAWLLLKPSAARDRLTAGMFISDDPKDTTGCLEYTLEKVIAADLIERKMAQAGYRDQLTEAVQAGIISADDAELIIEAQRATDTVIHVDDFDPQELTANRTVPQTHVQALAS